MARFEISECAAIAKKIARFRRKKYYLADTEVVVPVADVRFTQNRCVQGFNLFPEAAVPLLQGTPVVHSVDIPAGYGVEVSILIQHLLMGPDPTTGKIDADRSLFGIKILREYRLRDNEV